MTSADKRRRVFIVSPTESELTTRGKRHPNLASHLSRQGWDVHYVSSTFNHAEKRLFSEKECDEAEKRLPYRLTLVRNGGYGRNLSFARIRWNQRFSYRVYRFLKKEICEEDILVVPSRPPELIFAVAKLKRCRGCRTVLDIRDIWPDAMSESSGLIKRGFAAYCNFFLCRSVASYDACIHVAPSFLPWLKRYAPSAQSTFIPLGFDERRWGDESPTRLLPQDGHLKLVHCGTLSYQLDVMPVLEAIARLRDRVSLTLIGDNGNGERRADVMAFIRAQQLGANVRVLGLLPPEELVQELPRHDIAIVPMVSGALPNKVFDSIAAGLPMLSLGGGDSSALVKNANLGWTSAFNGDEVFCILNQITADDIGAKSQNVLQHRREYMHQTLLKRYDQVLRSVL